MARMKTATQTNREPQQKRRPALSPEAREAYMADLAMKVVEQRMLDGTASSQETTHFLKLVSSKTKLENERLAEENKLLRAKTEALEKQKKDSVDYQEVIRALRSYNGTGDEDEYDY